MVPRPDQNMERIFVDESGGTDLPSEAQATPDVYVIAGIYFPETDYAHYSAAAKAIVRQFAGSGELKSSRVGARTGRRAEILLKIAEGHFPFYCLVVDKTEIWRDSGLEFSSSFYKFLHRMFYAPIRGTFIRTRVLADRHKHSEFMKSFKRYIGANLFESFEFDPSPEVPLLQIADVIAGTVRRVFMNEDRRDLLNILGYSSATIEQWPPVSIRNTAASSPSEFDAVIAGIALRAAREYVEQHLHSDDEDDCLRAHAIRYLLRRFDQNPREYVHRAEITTYLEDAARRSLSLELLSTKVLANARDNGVMLASTDKGVKIPLDSHDLSAWMERTESQVAPYLRRVEAARRRVLIASHNEYDIADPANFPELSRYLGNSHGK